MNSSHIEETIRLKNSLLVDLHDQSQQHRYFNVKGMLGAEHIMQH
jgi:hypothetical protein